MVPPSGTFGVERDLLARPCGVCRMASERGLRDAVAWRWHLEPAKCPWHAVPQALLPVRSDWFI